MAGKSKKEYKIVDTFNGHVYGYADTERDADEKVERIARSLRKKRISPHINYVPQSYEWLWNYRMNEWEWMEP